MDHKIRLLAQLAELEARQGRIAEDLAEPLRPGSDEAAIEVEDDESKETCSARQGAFPSLKNASLPTAFELGQRCMRPQES